MRGRFPCLALAFFVTAQAWGDALERAFWVWNRAQPLTVEETAELSRPQVHTLLWNIGELENHHGIWNWKKAPLALDPLAPEFHVVPVVRLTSEGDNPL